MGGKQKQAQRIKGNARPSNSSRSAERLLASAAPGASAARLGGFVGFSNIQLQTDHLAVLKAAGGSAGEVDPLMDGDCRMLMKRMTKKDAVTRLKALQEFQHLCGTCGEDSLLGALPAWPRLFNKLCLDVDRKVREAAHNANKQLVLRMKRNVAPHIKAMMGHWLLGLCDPHAPAATAAKTAFDSAFSQEKRLEAVVYCKENVFATLADYSFHQNPQTLADSEAVPVEVAEETYDRVLSSSLLALACVLDLVSPNECQKLRENYEKIIGEGKFWKFPKSQVPQVRSAWFSAVAAICGKIPAVLENHLPKLCPAVFGKLDESEPLVVSSVWDAALHVSIAFETCWTHVNLQKAVLPKLMTILRKGCDGNAKAIGPYLLPLLSRIPADVCPTAGEFYADFFANLRTGIALEKVQSSGSECGALVAAYVECLRFLVIDASSALRKDANAAEDLILTNLLPIIESSLVEESSRLSLTPLYPLLGEFASRLRHLSSSSDGGSASYYRGLEKFFWDSFGRLCLNCVENSPCEKDRSFCLLNLRSMLAALSRKEQARPTSKRKAESRKVRFSDEPKEQTAASTAVEAAFHRGSSTSRETVATDAGDAQKPDDFVPDANLADCASRLCAAASKKYESEKSFSHLGFLVEANAMFASRELCGALLDAAAVDRSEEDVVTRLYESVVLKWLTEASRKDAISLLIRLAFDVLNLIDDGRGKLAALNKLCEAGSAVVLFLAVREVLHAPRCLDAATRSWLEGPVFSEAITERAEMLRGSDSDDDWAMWGFLEMCPMPHGGRSVFAPECVGRLLDIVRRMLPTSVVGAEERTMRVCGLAKSYFGIGRGFWTYAEGERLFSSVLELGWRLSVGPSRNPDCGAALDSAVEACWKAGIGSLMETQDGPAECLLEACKFIRSRLFRDADPMANLTAATEFLRKFFDAVRGSADVDADRNYHGSDGVRSAAMKLLSVVLPTEEEWAEMYSGLCRDGLAAHAVGGKLLFAEATEEQSADPSDGRALASSVLAAELLSCLVKSSQDRSVAVQSFLLPHQLGILNTMSYCSLLEKNRRESLAGRSWSQWGDVLWEKQYVLLDAGCGELLLDECFRRARRQGYLYAYSLRYLVTFLGVKIGIDETLAELADAPCAQVLQVLVPTMEGGRRLDLLKRLMNEEEYGDAKWLAVVNACVCRRGSAGAKAKSSEKTRKSETFDRCESLVAPRALARSDACEASEEMSESVARSRDWSGLAEMSESLDEVDDEMHPEKPTVSVESVRECLGESIETLELSTETPEKSSETSEKSSETSEKSRETSEKSIETSEKSDETSEKSDETSEKSDETSEKSDETSEKSDETSEKSDETSEKSGETSEKSIETSEKSVETSEKSGETSEKSGETSEKSIETSEKSSETSEKSSEISEKSVETSEKSVETSEKSGETSEKSIETLDRSFEALERSVVASELSIETSDVNQNSVKSANLEESTAEIVKEILRGLRRYKVENPDSFLFDRELPDQWPLITLNVQLVSLLTTLATDHWSALEPEHWDFVLCSLGSWLQTCHESRFLPAGGELRFDAFAIAVYRLAAVVAVTVNCRMVDRDSEVTNNLMTEWSEFYAGRFYVLLLDLFAASASNAADAAPRPATEALVAALEWIPAEAVVNNDLPPCLDARWDDNDAYLPTKVSTALNFFSPLLTSGCPHVQRGSYAVLRSLVAVLPGFAAKDLQQDDACVDLVPGALMTALVEAGVTVDEMLADADFGQPSAAGRPALVRGYLYAACLVLRLFAEMSPEARSGQATFLRDSGVVAALLKNLFRLMPADPAKVAVRPSKKGAGGKTASSSAFSELSAADPNDSADLRRLSFSVYLEVLRRLPALVREWWSGLDRRASVLADRLTARSASPLLCAEDISAVQTAQRKFGNMSIRTRPSTREVIASYDVDEVKFELVVRLADNHPLGPVVIETGRRLGVTSPQWRVWLLQLTTFLMHQNGSILDGLLLWKRNIDKKFEGVEECYVCYYVLHSSTCQLPKKVCRTCKKKFHSSCLYKWFTTSGHSTCPLCRSIW